MKTLAKMRADAVAIFEAGVAAVAPGTAIHRCCRREGALLRLGSHSLNLDEFRNVIVVGAGKAAGPMGSAMEQLLGDRITRGAVTVKYGHTTRLEHIEMGEGGHPLPDAQGQFNAEKILRLAEEAQENDLLVCLLSGGGSALLPLPVDALSLEDKQAAVDALLACGASIHELNTIRKHISRIKGGRLAVAAAPARLVSLILSDVVGDDLDVIASGPTVADPSTFADCRRILQKYGIEGRMPKTVMRHLDRGLHGDAAETPKNDHPAFHGTSNLIVGSNSDAIAAARDAAVRLGYDTIVLSSVIEGDTREAARFHTAVAREIRRSGNPVPPPACLLSGGETTVKVSGSGLGGRNQEFVLAAALNLAACEGVVVLSAGTDGTDGPTDAAGALADTQTLRRAAFIGLDPNAYLHANDSYHFFQRMNDLLITGPTRTNVMDLRILLVR
jgi:hydroxypyruvate reductase